ncbi:MAG: hypothetical protein ACK5FE_10120 [Cyanobacteriota bacterium]
MPQLPEGSVMLLYDSPDRLLTLRSHSTDESSAGGRWLSLSDLASGYRQLLELRSTGRLFSIWRLERLEDGAWLSCLHGDADLPAMDLPEAPASLEAAVISRLLEASPEILSLYQDLELETEVGHGNPHTTYMNDLRNQYQKDPESLLQDFQKQHHDLSSGMPTRIRELEASISIMRQECIARAQQVEMAMIQITQLQNHIDFVSGDAFENDELKESLEASMQQTQLLVLQLAQVEEELIRQHKEASGYRELMSAQTIQIQRACQLMHSSAGWEGIGSSSGGASIEVLALLEGYRHSLKRAERLLSGEPD